MGEIISTKRIAQIGIVVHDIEASAKKFAEIFGMPVPNISTVTPYEKSKVVYNGQPAPEAGTRLAFFHFDNIQLELLEPTAAPSTWRTFLDTKGEGIQHLAFQVENSEPVIANFAKEGMGVEQQGNYASGTGRYTYIDSTKDLKFITELLENF